VNNPIVRMTKVDIAPPFFILYSLICHLSCNTIANIALYAQSLRSECAIFAQPKVHLTTQVAICHLSFFPATAFILLLKNNYKKIWYSHKKFLSLYHNQKQ